MPAAQPEYVVRVDPELCRQGGAFITIPNPRLRDGVNVLVVDDDADDIEMIVDTLECNNSVKSIHSADGGSKAIHILESGEFRPDIIFLDLNMPQVNGYQVLDCVRAISGFENIPVIVLTTSARIEDIRKSLRGSATSYIVKPDSSEELKAKTSDVIQCVIDGSYIEKQL
jgi:CheY-like chemotaxis protein